MIVIKRILSLPLNFSNSPGTNTDKNSITVCITGKLKDFKNRNDAAKYLESLGYTVTDSVTNKN